MQAEVKSSGLSGRLAPFLSSSTTSSRLALLLSLLSLVLLLTLLALGLSSLSSLPTMVEEQGREVRRHRHVLEQQQEELASLLGEENNLFDENNPKQLKDDQERQVKP